MSKALTFLNIAICGFATLASGLTSNYDAMILGFCAVCGWVVVAIKENT